MMEVHLAGLKAFLSVQEVAHGVSTFFEHERQNKEITDTSRAALKVFMVFHLIAFMLWLLFATLAMYKLHNILDTRHCNFFAKKDQKQ